jgi:hypothetical protein
VSSLQTLLARLARIADQLDPVPAMTYELGYASLGLRRLDAQLAELVADSADSAGLVGVRGPGDVRLLAYEAAELSVDVQVAYDRGRRWLVGQVDGTATDLRVETTSGVTPVGLDEVGRFRVDLPPGLFRLHLAGSGGVVSTSWVTI